MDIYLRNYPVASHKSFYKVDRQDLDIGDKFIIDKVLLRITESYRGGFIAEVITREEQINEIING